MQLSLLPGTVTFGTGRRSRWPKWSQWVGFVPDLAPWFQRADVVVLPSLWEGLPNVVLESLATATPCIASDVEGVREALAASPEWVVPPVNPSLSPQHWSLFWARFQKPQRQHYARKTL